MSISLILFFNIIFVLIIIAELAFLGKILYDFLHGNISGWPAASIGTIVFLMFLYTIGMMAVLQQYEVQLDPVSHFHHNQCVN